ncbi:MAG: YdcH family protein [Xanthomonadales bacterium]|nr:YdcH family protein [Xanthomonadales bacterium]
MFENRQKEVEALIQRDPEFRQLYQRHRELDKQVHDAEIGCLPLDDATLTRMKREKLRAKDRLQQIFESHYRASGA